ncbi:MAG: YsnF/AvaK domain-containing protein [Nakamurella sp.]
MTVPPENPDDAVPQATVQELILSEERLEVSTIAVPARRMRLEKYVVTETRTITVQVSHEEVRLVDIELDDDNAAADRVGDEGVMSADPGRWLTLSEERVAITTQVVPVERVRLAVASVVEHRAITKDARREEIAFDAGTNLPGTPPATQTPTRTAIPAEES